MKKLFACAALMLLSTPAWAILSPINQSINEFSALLRHPQLPLSFEPNEQIVGIVKEDDAFIVVTPEHSMIVHVVYKPNPNKVGPQLFDLEFTQARKNPKPAS